MPELRRHEININANSKNQSTQYIVDCYRYRTVLHTLAIRAVKVQYANTSLGALWSLIQPAVSLGLLLFIFTRVARAEMCGHDPIPFILTGLISWTWFASAVTGTISQAESLRELSSKVYFPRIFISLAPVLASAIDFAIVLLMALIVSGFQIHSIITLIIAIAAGVAVTSISALLIGSMSVRFHDIRHTTPLLLRILFLVSPIGYCLTDLNDSYQLIVGLNPISGTIELYRYAFFGSTMNPVALWSTLFYCLVGCPTVIYIWSKIDRQLGDL